jgi:hypothetical protein
MAATRSASSKTDRQAEEPITHQLQNTDRELDCTKEELRGLTARLRRLMKANSVALQWTCFEPQSLVPKYLFFLPDDFLDHLCRREVFPVD